MYENLKIDLSYVRIVLNKDKKKAILRLNYIEQKYFVPPSQQILNHYNG
jgi:archaellin